MSKIQIVLNIESEYDRPNSRYVATVTSPGHDGNEVHGVKRGIGTSHKEAILRLVESGGLVSPAVQVVRGSLEKDAPADKKE